MDLFVVKFKTSLDFVEGLRVYNSLPRYFVEPVSHRLPPYEGLGDAKSLLFSKRLGSDDLEEFSVLFLDALTEAGIKCEYCKYSLDKIKWIKN